MSFSSLQVLAAVGLFPGALASAVAAASLVPDGSLPGIVEGMQGMKAGGQRILNIPYEDAFGEDGNADIKLPAKTDLVLVVDLFAVI